jgi:hypothetical protein
MFGTGTVAKSDISERHPVFRFELETLGKRSPNSLNCRRLCNDRVI